MQLIVLLPFFLQVVSIVGAAYIPTGLLSRVENDVFDLNAVDGAASRRSLAERGPEARKGECDPAPGAADALKAMEDNTNEGKDDEAKVACLFLLNECLGLHTKAGTEKVTVSRNNSFGASVPAKRRSAVNQQSSLIALIQPDNPPQINLRK
ncbi:hypothetical protein C8J57DRAFT_1674615 [Mycena rebaudengoi]|nr:hypothetical protein C8J57DRAFT_1674615 [Mycena rebaudengoi]